MKNKISELTPEQILRFEEWRKTWIDIGMSTEPADFDAATKAALKGYESVNLDQPTIVLHVGSPYAAAIGGALACIILKEIKEKFSSRIIPNQIKDRIDLNQTFTKIMEETSVQIERQIYNQVSARIWSQISTQIRNRILTQVWSRVRNPVMDQIISKVKSQVGYSIAKRVKNQNEGQIWDQVCSQIWHQVREHVMDHVWEHVGRQVQRQVQSQVRNQIKNLDKNHDWNRIRNSIYNGNSGAFHAAFCSFVTFFRDVVGINIPAFEKFSIYESLAKTCGWVWWHENVLVISDRPQEIHRDAEGRLHNEKGPSISYRDGWSLYHWHGISIPEEWVTGSLPSAKEAINWPNIEQRRAACKMIGWSNIFQELDVKVIDEDGDPEIGVLLEVDLPNSGIEKFLQVRCGTGRDFVLPVPPTVATALEANAWTWDLEDYEYKPEVRT